MSARRRRPAEKDEDASQQRKAHYSFWSGTITFGLVLAKDKLKRGIDVIDVETDATSDVDAHVEAPIDLVALLEQRLESSPQAPEQQSPRSKNGSSPLANDLELKPKSALYKRAKSLGIRGRSTMTKQDLARAIQKAAS